MDTTQAAQMIQLLTDISSKLDTLIWLGTTSVLGIGILWGCAQWRLTLLSKNQRHFW
jgi:hypothetical protein